MRWAPYGGPFSLLDNPDTLACMTTLIRSLTVGIILVLLLTAATCEERGKPSATPKPAAPVSVPAPKAGQPAPKADPCNCPADNDPDNYVHLIVSFSGERAGSVEVQIEGGDPFSRPVNRPLKTRDGAYYGLWNEWFSIPPGRRVGFTYFGKPGNTNVHCEIVYKNQVLDYQDSPKGPNCAASAVRP